MMQPTQLPDAATLSAAATGISSCLAQFDSAITELTHGWSALAASYSAPEDEVVLTAFTRLGPMRDDLVTLAGDAGRALDDFAAVVAGLATRRAALVEDIAAYLAAPVDPEAPSLLPDLEARVLRFDLDAEAADRECAAALSAFHRYYSWSIGEGLDIATSIPAGTAQGLASEMLQRYRVLWVPVEGAALPDIPRLDRLIPDEVIGGRPYVRSPGGLLVPLGSTPPEPPPSLTARPPGFDNHTVLSGKPSLGSPPEWARWGGRSLAVVGAGLTYWGSYTDRYNDTLTQHPEWTEEQRVQSSATHSAVVGSASVGGGMAAAWGGAAAGAAIGSIFPGPGTLIGGIVGGVVGGVVGGEIGKGIGEWAMGLFGGDE